MKKTIQEEPKRGKNSGFFLILLVVAAVIYLIVAGKAGSFLSDKIVKPVVSFFTQNTDKDSEENPAVETVGVNVKFPAFEMYLLQVGIFSEESNAEKSSAEISSMGGAGYIREENGDHRVIISGYATKDDAENVKERLLSEQNMETKILELQVPEVTYTLNTEQSVLEEFTEIAKRSAEYPTKLMELSLQFDKGEVSADSINTELELLLDEVKQYKITLEGFSGESEDVLLQKAYSFYTTLVNEYSAFAGDMTEIELSARIKHGYIASAYAYQSFLAVES